MEVGQEGSSFGFRGAAAAMQRGLDVVQRIVQFPQLGWELDMLVMPGFQRQLQRLQEQRILEKTPAEPSAVLSPG